MKSKIWIIFIFSMVWTLIVSHNVALASNRSDLVSLIDKTMKDWDVPGLSVAIIRGEKVIFSSGFGYRDLKNKLRVTEETLFPIASCTKSFTAFSTAILVDEKKLDWDVPIIEYIPGFQMKNIFITKNITLRDLLSHRSGMPQHYRMYYNSGLSRKEIISRMKYLLLSESFRNSFQYTNLMYMLAAYVVENVSGIPWEEFVNEKIFKTLHMMDSNFSLHESKITGNFSRPYRKTKDGIIEIPYFQVGSMTPAGGIISNISDLSNWLILQINNGLFEGNQIVSSLSLTEMHTPQIRLPQYLKREKFPWSFYGLGWSIRTYKGNLMVSHGGGFDGFSSLISFMPGEKLGVVVLTNMENSPVPTILANSFYDSLLDFKKTDWNSSYKKIFSNQSTRRDTEERHIDNVRLKTPLSCFSGEYYNPGYGSLIVKKTKKHLIIEHNNLSSMLRYCGNNVFKSVDEHFNLGSEPIKVSFNTNKKGEIESVSVPFEPNVDDILFIKKN